MNLKDMKLKSIDTEFVHEVISLAHKRGLHTASFQNELLVILSILEDFDKVYKDVVGSTGVGGSK